MNSIFQQIYEARERFERGMREVTQYGLVPYDATPIVNPDPTAVAHRRIDVLIKLSVEILDVLNRIEQQLDRDDGK